MNVSPAPSRRQSRRITRARASVGHTPEPRPWPTNTATSQEPSTTPACARCLRGGSTVASASCSGTGSSSPVQGTRRRLTSVTAQLPVRHPARDELVHTHRWVHLPACCISGPFNVRGLHPQRPPCRRLQECAARSACVSCLARPRAKRTRCTRQVAPSCHESAHLLLLRRGRHWLDGWRCGQAGWECQALPRTDWQVEVWPTACVDSVTKKAALGTANHTVQLCMQQLHLHLKLLR